MSDFVLSCTNNPVVSWQCFLKFISFHFEYAKGLYGYFMPQNLCRFGLWQKKFYS